MQRERHSRTSRVWFSTDCESSEEAARRINGEAKRKEDSEEAREKNGEAAREDLR